MLPECSDLIMFYGIYPRTDDVRYFYVWNEDDTLCLLDQYPNGYNKIEVPKESIRQAKNDENEHTIISIDCEDGIKNMVFENKIESILNQIGIYLVDNGKEVFNISLIKCSVCGKEISIEADSCPNCGQPNKNKKITCPNCRSGNVQKIGMGSKVFSVAMVGIHALGKTSKTWECKDCDYKW